MHEQKSKSITQKVSNIYKVLNSHTSKKHPICVGGSTSAAEDKLNIYYNNVTLFQILRKGMQVSTIKTYKSSELMLVPEEECVVS